MSNTAAGLGIGVVRGQSLVGAGGVAPPTDSFLLLEDGSFVLLEDGSKVLLE